MKPYLKAGKNVIGVEVLFYGLGDGTWPGGKPGLIVNLAVQTPGGNRQVVSDGSWQALLDRAHRPGQYKRWFLRACRRSSMRGFIRMAGTARFCRRFAVGRRAEELPCPPDKRPGCRSEAIGSADSVDHGRRRWRRCACGRSRLTRETIIRRQRAGALGPRALETRSGRLVRRADGGFVRGGPEAGGRAPAGGGGWELPATPQPRPGVEATFEFAEQIAGFPRFRIEPRRGRWSR